jgi:AraC-like DNA-binding protein
MSQSNIFVPTVFVQKNLYNLEEINIFSQGWDNRWRSVKSGGVNAQLWFFTTPRMQFSWIGYSNGIMIEGSHPRGTVVLSFVRSNGVCSFKNQKFEDYEVVVLEHGEELDYFASSANEIFTIAIEKTFFHREFHNYFDTTIDVLRKENRLIMKKEQMRTFVCKMYYLLNCFQTKESKELTLDNHIYIEEDIIETLLKSIYTKERKISKGHMYVKQAREIFEDNMQNIYTIKDLLNELDINARTLQYSFKNNFGISAKQYFQNIRLNAIKKELLQSDAQNTKISDISLKYGFFHSSYLSAEYKKLFNETPTETLMKNQ